MIKSSQHILKFSNKDKLNYLDRLFKDYKIDLQFYVDQILLGNYSCSKFLSSKDISPHIIYHSQWKQIIFKQAAEIVRSNIKYQKNKRYRRYKKVYSYFKNKGRQIQFTSKRFRDLQLKDILQYVKVTINNISIAIDQRLLSYDIDSKHFNEFIGIRLPYFQEGKKRAIQINFPIKQHRHSLKFSCWNRKNTIQLKKINYNYYIRFTYKTPNTELKTEGNIIGFDIGYNKLLVDSDGNIYGKEINLIYDKISRKQQGGNAFKRALIERDNKINEIINRIDFSKIKTVYVEDLKNVKHKSKFAKQFNNKLQRWSYPKVLGKFQSLCMSYGLGFEKVNPSYTSQMCCSCGFVDKKSRNGSLFKCTKCKIEMDADHNAAINILHRGVYNPPIANNLKQ